MTAETKTDAIRPTALDLADRSVRRRRFLDQEVWPPVPEGEMGRRLRAGEEDAILGFGADGV